MKAAAILTALVLLMLPAHAAEDAAKGDAKKGGKPGTNVDMPYLMAPVTDADGKLTGYAYITSRLTASSEAIVTDVREKLPFIQDLMVRDVNGAGVTLPNDATTVNIPGVEARLLADARKVMGAGKVRLLTVCTVQLALLHPVQSSANIPPGKTSADAPAASRCET